jgi:ABC-2 type transport system permease protein
MQSENTMASLGLNRYGVWAIYNFEMARWFRTLWQSVAAPVISTALYFVVFGAAIGSRMQKVSDIEYGAFIVPGMIMMSVLTQSLLNGSFGIYFPKFAGTIYEILSAPVSALEIVLGYVGAAVTKSVILGLLILGTAEMFTPIAVQHPFWMFTFLVLTALSFSMLGFIIGVLSESFEQLSFIPNLVVTPLIFLGGAFYSIDMLPPFWRTVSYFNPVVYLISGFRWSFFGTGDVRLEISLGFVSLLVFAAMGTISWIFKTGYRLKQ